MRKRLVRLHLAGDNPSIDGLLVTPRTRRTGNHYVVELASVVEAEERTLKLEGESVMIPRERVVFVQVLK